MSGLPSELRELIEAGPMADLAADVAHIADALGWPRFAVTGFSGGGPHALACAALLPGRITCCAAVASPAPADAEGVGFFADRRRVGQDFRLARRGEQALRPYLEARASDALAGLAATRAGRRRRAWPPAAPDSTRDPAAGHVPGPGRLDRRRHRARPALGLRSRRIAAPVSLWHGVRDTQVPRAHPTGCWPACPARRPMSTPAATTPTTPASGASRLDRRPGPPGSGAALNRAG